MYLRRSSRRLLLRMSGYAVLVFSITKEFTQDNGLIVTGREEVFVDILFLSVHLPLCAMI